MTETGCLEIVVSKKKSTLIKLMFIAAIILAVCFFILIFTGRIWGIVGLAASCAAIWYLWLQLDVDYEYAYVDKELRVAQILRKSKRKEIGVYDLSSLQIAAPIGSPQLEPFRARAIKTLDFTSGSETDKEGRYGFVLEDGTMLLLDLNDPYGQGKELLEILRNRAPRAVHI
ncbi:MAG: hypothetical protein IJG52_02775 [Lachnospiraceae bacterium]|nr:hypothetical protein [Lachnospiraceae bacterium]